MAGLHRLFHWQERMALKGTRSDENEGHAHWLNCMVQHRLLHDPIKINVHVSGSIALSMSVHMKSCIIYFYCLDFYCICINGIAPLYSIVFIIPPPPILKDQLRVSMLLLCPCKWCRYLGGFVFDPTSLLSQLWHLKISFSYMISVKLVILFSSLTTPNSCYCWSSADIPGSFCYIKSQFKTGRMKKLGQLCP